jgi:hypothetical protein
MARTAQTGNIITTAAQEGEAIYYTTVNNVEVKGLTADAHVQIMQLHHLSTNKMSVSDGVCSGSREVTALGNFHMQSMKTADAMDSEGAFQSHFLHARNIEGLVKAVIQSSHKTDTNLSWEVYDSLPYDSREHHLNAEHLTVTTLKDTLGYTQTATDLSKNPLDITMVEEWDGGQTVFTYYERSRNMLTSTAFGAVDDPQHTETSSTTLYARDEAILARRSPDVTISSWLPASLTTESTYEEKYLCYSRERQWEGVPMPVVIVNPSNQVSQSSSLGTSLNANV